MQYCEKCVLSDTYPAIQFDSDGQCNFCRNFQAYQYRGNDALQDIIAPFRNGSGDYDCIVSLSGGRDSSYVLFYVVDVLKLRPLVLSVDNGFMPDETRQNIDNAVRILGVDHVYERQTATLRSFSATLKAWQNRPDPAMIAFLCNSCQGPIKKAVIKVAHKNGLSLVIGGGGELVGSGGEPEGSFAESLLGIGTGFLDRRLSLACGAFVRMLSNYMYLRSPSILLSYIREAYSRFWLKYPKDLTVIGLFDFLEWDEDHIVSTIRSRLEWVKPPYWNTTWRADCKVHWLKEFLYKETLGFTKNNEILSGMVREGMITREEALTRLEKANELPEDYLAEFVAERGVEFTRLRAACRQWREARETR